MFGIHVPVFVVVFPPLDGLVVRTKQPNGEGLLLVGAGVQLKGEAVDVVGVIRDLLHQAVDGNVCFQRIQRAVRQVQAVNGEALRGFSPATKNRHSR